MKSHFTLAIIVIYLTLLIAFIVYEQKEFPWYHYREENCTSACLHFCPPSEKYSNDELERSLNGTLNYNSDFLVNSGLNENFSIIKSELKCDNFEIKIIIEDLKGVELIYVSYFLFCKIFYI